MRLALAALLLATPLHAWEFSATPVCTLTEQTPAGGLKVTHDPRLPEPYVIAITRPVPWPEAPAFGIRYDGVRPLAIGTDRHRLSADRRTLTVTDRGFGNVLDGLEFNARATAVAGDATLAFDLAGAAGPVRDFRACAEAPTS